MDFDIHLEGAWHPCATLTPTTDHRSVRAPIRVRYEADYAIEHLGARDHRALSVRAPVNLAFRTLPHWPSFLVDLLPQGAARKRLDKNAATPLAPWELLERGAVNPVGNLRVHPGQPALPVAHPGFTLQEMVERGDAFVDHALAQGAAVAGATDTQGEAPKFWVVEDDAGRWHPDSGQLSVPIRRHALLKFPVPEAGGRAEEILRHEAIFQAAAARLGLRVTPDLPQFLNGALLIPRFDRRMVDAKEIRLGVESLYSVMGVIDSASVAIRHDQVLIELAQCVDDFETEFVEYARRDFLNLALGNRDNHGRNQALLKDVDGTIRLAPIYDFGPAYLDARAIARVIHWDGEAAGGGAWPEVLERLEIRFEEAGLESARHAFLRAVAITLPQLHALPEILRTCGAAEGIVAQRVPEIRKLAADLRALEALP
jgi:serine/threonine-protein kinase HipA